MTEQKLPMTMSTSTQRRPRRYGSVTGTGRNGVQRWVFVVLSLLMAVARPSSGQTVSTNILISPWWIPNVIPYPDLVANVGDTIEFQWVGVHNVFIHPSGDCTQTDRIAVGNISPVIYTFTPDDAGKNLTFACDVRSQSGTSGTHCEFGMRFNVFVNSPPTELPTEPPEADPTEAPVDDPTEAPVEPPVAAPVVPPVAPEPTDAPVEPTEAPTETPVAPPTAAPTTAPPVDDPTEAPVTPAPTTEAPVVIPTDSPTDEPTIDTSEAPSPSPTDLPTTMDGLTEATVSGLRMGLLGIDDFPPDTESTWEQLTALFSRSQNRFLVYNSTLLNYTTTITVTDFVLESSRRFRHLTHGQDRSQGERSLQDSVIFVQYDQFIRYRTVEGNAGDEITPEVLATTPFQSSGQRSAYQSLLNQQGDPILALVSGVTPVFLPDSPTAAPAPTSAPEPDDDGGGLSMGAIIGIAAGGGVLLLAALGAFMYMGSGKSGASERQAGTETAPPTTITGSKSINGDEVSTLAPPDVRGGPMGDQSVGTIDYDYSKAYGNTGDGTVSSAGGTFGSNTYALATGAALGSSDITGSFRDHYRNPNANVKEELIHIFAPPGKLGVVIDTPDDGAPVIHAVKDSSVIADKIQVDDKLVAVDDEDVRQMTAIKVSKLISHKSANPSRKLTVLRTTVIE